MRLIKGYKDKMKEYTYKKVAVIMGGSSSEREISLISGAAVLESLIKSGFNAYKFDPSEKSLCALLDDDFDCAVIMLHGIGGEDGVIQGALEALKIPYTGSSVMASAIAMDKYRTKLIWQSCGVPTPNSQYINSKTFNEHSFVLALDLPVVVKPANGGSTVGLSKVYNIEDLQKAITVAFKYDSTIIIEEMIIGEEFTITVFDSKVYPLVKIEAPEGEYDYQNKYFTDITKYICPYDLGEAQNRLVENYALIAYEAIGASGICRLDFMIDKNQQIYFLELNTIPGMTSHSLVPMAFKSRGYSFDDLCLQMLADAKLHI
jgi:D-alanine-D-alanine ligase